MIAVIDIGISNVNSVCRALSVLKVEYKLTADPQEIQKADRLVFPGVGTFYEASRRLVVTGLRTCIREMVLERGVPILGICLGMQLLAEDGEEGGAAKGLGLIKARVTKLKSNLRLPHVGWNDVTDKGASLLEDMPGGTCFYFVHSFAMVPEEPVQIALSNYGGDFVAVVQKNHIFGTQFHPEKSQMQGLEILKKFSSLRN